MSRDGTRDGVTAPTAREEWRAGFSVPLAAALGYATSVIHIYGLGAYIKPISETFTWSITQTTVGLTIATLIQAVFGIPIGLLVDRIGPRLLSLVGVVSTLAAFALLGTATGSAPNWYLLWIVMACATLPVQATIWTSAVASRFSTSRGLALAVTLCGASVAAALFPYLGTRLINAYGWQHAFAIQALIWGVVAFPAILLFFHSSRDLSRKQHGVQAHSEVPQEGMSFLEGVRSTIYVRLLLVSLLFTFTTIALVVHFQPILQSSGFDAMRAAEIAALIGLFSIVGRLGTGLLLDRFQASLVGATVFLLPIAGCVALIAFGKTAEAAMLAASLIGLTLGAEIDVLAYLTTKHFGLRSFGALYGGLLAALSIGTATGPLAAARVFDVFRSYNNFLWLTIIFMLMSSLSLVSLPRPALGKAQI